MASCDGATVHSIPRSPLLRPRDRRPDRPAVRRAVRRRPRRAQRSSSVQHHPCRRAPGVGGSRAIRTGGRDAAAVDRRRRDGVRRSADLHAVPPAVHRCEWRAAQHRRRARWARGRSVRRVRGPPPRTDHAQGVDRPARPHAFDTGQHVADLGAVARRRADRTARRTRRADRVRDDRWCRTHGGARERPRPHRGDQREDRHRRRPHRGRSPSVWRRTEVP